MISVKCKECKKELSVLNPRCPNCGHKTKRNILFIICGISILSLLLIFLILTILTNNKDYYSQRQINKIKLNNDTKELLANNGLSEELVTSYVKDYMKQYNNAFKNETTIETTDKGKQFTNYFNNDFNAKYQDEFTDVVLEFARLDYVNAEYIVKKLEIEMTFDTNDKPKLIINEKYYEYKDTMKKEIDYLLKKYFSTNDKDESPSNIEQHTLTSKEKYEKAMSLLGNDEKSAIELLREIPNYQDAKTYIDNYDLRHRFDGTYYMFSGDVDTAIEKDPSRRLVINGLKNKAVITAYSYNLYDLHLNGYIYYAGRYRTREEKLICNNDFSICKQIVLTTVDKDGYYEHTFNEKSDNIYIIKTFKFDENVITVDSHYVKKLYSFDEDDTTTYKKISNDTELPPESQDTKEPEEPKIGMTKSEVESSTWGRPKKINKDTYYWGTREQWVYDNGYIYFEDGIVTSISERQ